MLRDIGPDAVQKYWSEALISAPPAHHQQSAQSQHRQRTRLWCTCPLHVKLHHAGISIVRIRRRQSRVSRPAGDLRPAILDKIDPVGHGRRDCARVVHALVERSDRRTGKLQLLATICTPPAGITEFDLWPPPRGILMCMSDSPLASPYRVQRVQTPDGPLWRLIGPGLEETKAYPWEEFGEKLREMAELMNFAWNQAQKSLVDPAAGPH